MQLKYHDDIKWQDLPKIERPTIAQSTVRYELSRPLSGLRGTSFNDPLSGIYKSSCRDIDPDALNRLLTKIEEGSVLLVRTFEGDTSYPAFIWKADDRHPDKGQFILCDHVFSNVEFRLETLLNTVKRPQQGGSIKAAASVQTSEYGYIPATPTSTMAEGTVAEIATTIAKFLYQVGSKAVILSTLTPSSAGGTTTYAIANDPDLRIIESDLEPARFQRQVDGEWRTTGVQAKRVVNDGRSMGFEALSPDEMESLKNTGSIRTMEPTKAWVAHNDDMGSGDYEDVEEEYDSLDAAVGSVDPLDDVEYEGKTKNAGLTEQGFTEKWSGVDSDGVIQSAFKNPKTGKWTGGHRSSKNDKFW